MLAVFTAVLGFYSFTHTLGFVLRTKAARQAYQLSPCDARVLAHWSSKLIGVKASVSDRAEANALAQRALDRDPTAVSAIVTLGINAQLQGDDRGARQWFAYSNLLSRRDLRTRLWIIEDAVAGGDIKTALHNYDIALRTSRSARDLLFPILVSASSEPQVAAELVRTLGVKPNWATDFLYFASVNGKDPRSTARLFEKLQRTGVSIEGIVRANVVNSLIARNFFEDAWAYYASGGGSLSRGRVRDPEFSTNIVHPTPFDWVPATSDSGITASLRPNGKDGILDFSAPPSVGGVVVQQMQMLPPGRYLMHGRSMGIDQSEDARPYWTLQCYGGSDLGRVVLPKSPAEGAEFRGGISVPAKCPVQYLRLIARPSQMMTGLAGQVDRVIIRAAD